MWDYQVEVYHGENCMSNDSDIIKLRGYCVCEYCRDHFGGGGGGGVFMN